MGMGDGVDIVMRSCIIIIWFLSVYWIDINICIGYEDNIFVEWIMLVFRDRIDCVEIY